MGTNFKCIRSYYTLIRELCSRSLLRIRWWSCGLVGVAHTPANAWIQRSRSMRLAVMRRKSRSGVHSVKPHRSALQLLPIELGRRCVCTCFSDSTDADEDAAVALGASRSPLDECFMAPAPSWRPSPPSPSPSPQPLPVVMLLRLLLNCKYTSRYMRLDYGTNRIDYDLRNGHTEFSSANVCSTVSVVLYTVYCTVF